MWQINQGDVGLALAACSLSFVTPSRGLGWKFGCPGVGAAVGKKGAILVCSCRTKREHICILVCKPVGYLFLKTRVDLGRFLPSMKRIYAKNVGKTGNNTWEVIDFPHLRMSAGANWGSWGGAKNVHYFNFIHKSKGKKKQYSKAMIWF